MKLKLGIGLFLAILAFTFISQNTETVRVEFLVWSVEMSLVLLVFLVLGTGIIIGWLLGGYVRFANKRKHARDQQQVKRKEAVIQEKKTVSETHGENPGS